MSFTVSLIVSRVSPGPPKIKEWLKSMPSAVHAAEAFRMSSGIKPLFIDKSIFIDPESVPKSMATHPARFRSPIIEVSEILG